jgi:hypothetical protein
MDLRDGFFVESLTRRRRVPGEESGVTLIEGSDLEPGQFFDPRWNDALLVSGSEELEKSRKMFGDQCGEVERVVLLSRFDGGLGAGHPVSFLARFSDLDASLAMFVAM